MLGAKVVANCDLAIGESCDTSGLRGILPDPIDIINHSGNNLVSAAGAMATACIASVIANRLTGSREGNEHIRNRSALITGTLTAVAVNGFVESIDAFTADPLDMAYGVGTGMLAASMVNVRPPEIKE